MKRILTIQDISCLGKCSITVALPVISAMGVETTILPTAVLSTHTMFQNFTVKDLTDQLVPITEHWKKEGIHFDAIYTGYLGSDEEIEIVKKIFADFGGVTPSSSSILSWPTTASSTPPSTKPYAKHNASLCGAADIIVPNLTEACFMTDTEYREDYDEAYIKDLLAKLAALGSKVVVLTGIAFGAGKNGVYGLDTVSGEYFAYENDHIDAAYHGTGDVFSSVSVGGIVRGLSYADAFALAADYTADTIRETLKNPDKPWYGVDFEATIPELVKMLDAKLR